MKTQKPKQYGSINRRFYKPFKDPRKKKLFYGGAGSGKSISIAQHFLQGLCSGDGVRRLVLRKYLPSMKVSTLLVLRTILNEWEVPYIEHKTDHYIQVNDNYLYYMSLDDPEKVKGGEFKEIWMEEATEFFEDDYKQLALRLSRDKSAEDVQIYLSFNPIDENNWCVKLMNYGKTHEDDFLVHHSTYKDNIKNLSKTFVKELEDLINTDENFYRIYALGLPGVLKNKIYNHFQIENSDNWPWNNLNESLHFYGLDFGYNHPMSLCEIWYFEDEFYIKERFYEREKTTDDLAVWMQLNGISHTDYIFADSAEPDRITMLCTSRKVSSIIDGQELSIYVPSFNVNQAKKDVKAGIDFIKGKKIHLCSKAVNGIREYNNYKYKEDKNGNVFEEPVKAFDDFCFVAGTLITTKNGKIPIEDIKIGDSVLTRSGFNEVTACGLTSESSEVISLMCENNKSLTATRHHPVYVIGKGFIPIDTIRYGDYVLTENFESQTLKKSNLMESNLEDTQAQKDENIGAIILLEERTESKALRRCIKRFGSFITEKSQQVIQFIIRIVTPSTTQLKILNASQNEHILKNMLNSGMKIKSYLNGKENTVRKSENWLRNGTPRKRGTNGILKMGKGHGVTGHRFLKYVTNVVKSSKILLEKLQLGFVQTCVNQNGDVHLDSMTNRERVHIVDQNLNAINMEKTHTALKVVQLKEDGKKERVYNLTVKDTHEYFANGILVHNCDSLRYGCFTASVTFGLTGSCRVNEKYTGEVGYGYENDVLDVYAEY